MSLGALLVLVLLVVTVLLVLFNVALTTLMLVLSSTLVVVVIVATLISWALELSVSTSSLVVELGVSSKHILRISLRESSVVGLEGRSEHVHLHHGRNLHSLSLLGKQILISLFSGLVEVDVRGGIAQVEVSDFGALETFSLSSLGIIGIAKGNKTEFGLLLLLFLLLA